MFNSILKSIAPAVLLAAVVLLPNTLTAQTSPPDVILINGRIHTVDANDNEVEALPISGERISAVGRSDAISALADADMRVVDLEGRTVILGLIDSHIHAIRTGFSTARQVHWYDAASVEQAVARGKAAADELPDDVSIAVVEGWSRTQFSDPRLPTAAELFEAAGDHPVYIQHMRELAFVNAAGRPRGSDRGLDDDACRGFGRHEIAADDGRWRHCSRRRPVWRSR